MGRIIKKKVVTKNGKIFIDVKRKETTKPYEVLLLVICIVGVILWFCGVFRLI
ncbi:hypothetical protein [Flavobacterium terrisoli]|uniref:hypothetical protein n=1 Tax=Flavobacterium terrisoli TaxID=3242195 RepID=UPI0025433B36|nr:hypothetical protein [Flavobacterium buctense]